MNTRPDHPATRLKRMRESWGLSQRDLARQFKVSSGAIASWELGTNPIPGAVLKLIEIFEQNSLPHENPMELPGEEVDKLKKNFPKEMREHVAMSEIGKSFQHYLKDVSSLNTVSGEIKLMLIQRLLKSLAPSKGLLVKVAQLASYLELGLPVELRRALGTLQSIGTPLPISKIRNLIESERGCPLEKEFSLLHAQPLAVTSLAQVHRARLHDGSEVVVKIQHPRIPEILETQFGRLEFWNRLATLMGSSQNLLVEEVKRAVIRECDYHHEAAMQNRFRNIISDIPGVIVPRPHLDLCSARMLVSEYIPGDSFQAFAAKATQSRKNEAAEAMILALGVAAFCHGLVHSDLHPGNFIFTHNNVAILDFGRMIEFPIERMNLEADFFVAIMNGDKARAENLIRKLSIAKNPDSFNFDEFWSFLTNSQRHLMIDTDFKFTRQYVAELARNARRFSGRKSLGMTSESFWGFVFSASTWGLLADLEAECNWRRLGFRTFHPTLSEYRLDSSRSMRSTRSF